MAMVSVAGVAHHHNAAAAVHLVCCRANLILLGGAVILRADGDGHQAGLRTHNVFHRGKVFLCQSAMRYDHYPDQPGLSLLLLALQLAVSN